MRTDEPEAGFNRVTTVHSLVDEEVSDQDRRLSLFAGDVFVYGPRSTTLTFCTAAHRVVEELLGADPGWAQRRMSETEFAVLFRAATRGVRHVLPEHAAAVVTDLGCDPATTYMGPPTLAVTTGSGFIAHGLGTPQHPHRDTWYAASPSQLNWWVPLYDIDASGSFAFHPLYFDLPVQNSSSGFDYEEWLDARRSGRSYSQPDPLTQPRPLDPIELAPEIRISCPAGGVILSSVAHLYSTVPNETLKTHFNVHFQTVSEADLETGAGALNLDAEPQGSSLSGFVRCSDFGPIPDELVRRDLELRHRR